MNINETSERIIEKRNTTQNRVSIDLTNNFGHYFNLFGEYSLCFYKNFKL